MRRLVGRAGIDDGSTLGDRNVEQSPELGWIMLAVLVEGRDPLATGGGHPGKRRSVLAEVAAQPDRPYERMAVGEVTHHAGRAVASAVVHQQHLGDPVRAAGGRRRGLGEGLDLVDQSGEVALAAVDGHHDRDEVFPVQVGTLGGHETRL